MDSRLENKIFIGRTEELERMSEAVQKGKHVIVLGEEGLGKTALVDEFVRRFDEKKANVKIFISRKSSTLKNACVELSESMRARGVLKKKSRSRKIILTSDLRNPETYVIEDSEIINLKNTIYESLSKIHAIVIFDRLGKVLPKFYAFLEGLRDRSTLILAARSVNKQETGRLWSLSCDFKKIELEPLTFRESADLAMILLKDVGIDVSDQRKWLNKLLKISRGNPRILTDLCKQIRRRKSEGKAINIDLANIDLQTSDFLRTREIK